MPSKAQFVIDKITNSIEERLTGESFDTTVIPIGADEIKKVLKKDGWFFNWKNEFKEKGHQLYKLVIEGDNKIQGLISIELVLDQKYIEMHLIETAPIIMERIRNIWGQPVTLWLLPVKQALKWDLMDL